MDANATEPLRPEARAALFAALEVVGNPSSVHAAGRSARRVLEDARDALARRFGGDVVFTSGGTEADALAIHALGHGRRLLIGATEHDAVRSARRDAEILPVDSDGCLEVGALEAALQGGPALVCLMLANNETGTIQPVAEASALCRQYGARLHVDAVQAAGRVPTDLRALGASSLAVSSHKLGGAAGAGALVLAAGMDGPALIVGGGQEKGRRGGTPAVAVIASFAAAAEAASSDLLALRGMVEAAAEAAGGMVFGGLNRLPNTVCAALPGVAAQTQLIALDVAGVQVSAGSACSSGKVSRSHVLDAMGLGALAGEAIRISLPWNASVDDVQAFAAAIPPWPPAYPGARMSRRVYLDNQATTPCDPRVVSAMLPFFTERFGNAHSAEHAMGQDAEEAVETARHRLATLIGAEAREIVFTSGATEANNIAIKGAARFAAAQGSPRRRVITVATEHKCVLDSVSALQAEGFEPIHLPVGADGLLDPAVLQAALAVPTVLVSVMAANNETGVLHDLPVLAGLARAAGALFHTDAAQALGKVAFDVSGIDLASFSAHKLYGPKGVGALYVRRRPRVRLQPLFSGGGQERGLRSGTLPTPLIVGFGEACRIAGEEMAHDSARAAVLRDRLLAGLAQRLPGLRVNGSTEHRLPGNLNVTLPHREALAVMRASPALCVSTGSACSSAEVAPSYVLAAMGLSSASAARSLRVGIGRFTSADDIDFAVEALSSVPEPVEA